LQELQLEMLLKRQMRFSIKLKVLEINSCSYGNCGLVWWRECPILDELCQALKGFLASIFE
jgi:hypothetical protein